MNKKAPLKSPAPINFFFGNSLKFPPSHSILHTPPHKKTKYHPRSTRRISQQIVSLDNNVDLNNSDDFESDNANTNVNNTPQESNSIMTDTDNSLDIFISSSPTNDDSNNSNHNDSNNNSNNNSDINSDNNSDNNSENNSENNSDNISDNDSNNNSNNDSNTDIENNNNNEADGDGNNTINQTDIFLDQHENSTFIEPADIINKYDLLNFLHFFI